MNKINLNKAVALRIVKLLEEKNMTLYRLEQNSGIPHGTMYPIMNEKKKGVNLATIFLLAKGFNISVIEFLDDPLFSDENLTIFQ